MGVDPEPLQITKMNSTVFSAIFMVFLIASPLQAAPETQAVEDRTFCMANAATTCANSCTGVSCDETCTVISGISTVDPAPMLILQDARPRPRPQRLPPPRRLSYCFCCFLLQLV